MVYKGLRDISCYEGHLVVMRDISCLRGPYKCQLPNL